MEQRAATSLEHLVRERASCTFIESLSGLPPSSRKSVESRAHCCVNRLCIIRRRRRRRRAHTLQKRPIYYRASERREAGGGGVGPSVRPSVRGPVRRQTDRNAPSLRSSTCYGASSACARGRLRSAAWALRQMRKSFGWFCGKWQTIVTRLYLQFNNMHASRTLPNEFMYL